MERSETFLAHLEQAGVDVVRVKLDRGDYASPGKVAIVRQWLRERESAPTANKPMPEHVENARYRPTKGDLAFRDAHEPNPFEEAILLRDVSDAYLSVLISDNACPTSAGYKALLDAEMTRRGGQVARRANAIALGSLVVAIAAPVISIIAIMTTP